MEHISNDQEDRLNQHENSHMLYDETGHALLSLTKSRWKLREKHDQNFPMEEKAIVEKILASEERNKSKKSRKVNHLSKVI